MKFTQKIKDKWLKALRSGSYKQGYAKLRTENNSYCCLGVLSEVVKILISDQGIACGRTSKENVYEFMFENFDHAIVQNLWQTNDSCSIDSRNRPTDYKDDYSNVIPLIEALKVS